MHLAVTFYGAAAVWKQLRPARLDVYNAIGSLALLDRPLRQSLMTERIHSASAQECSTTRPTWLPPGSSPPSQGSPSAEHPQVRHSLGLVWAVTALSSSNPPMLVCVCAVSGIDLATGGQWNQAAAVNIRTGSDTSASTTRGT
jgi:hypothetical protein